MKIGKDSNMDFELPKDFNMKFIEKDMIFKVYKIRYTYKTIRGNIKENHKYLLSDYEEQAKSNFIEYINAFNREKPYRAILNVKILDIALLGNVTK